METWNTRKRNGNYGIEEGQNQNPEKIEHPWTLLLYQGPRLSVLTSTPTLTLHRIRTGAPVTLPTLKIVKILYLGLAAIPPTEPGEITPLLPMWIFLSEQAPMNQLHVTLQDNY